VAGTLIIVLPRLSRFHSSLACSMVPSVSFARSGVHSKEAKPWRPSLAS
jgi:hypothetical protein